MAVRQPIKERMEQIAAEERQHRRIDYATTGFMLKKPLEDTIVRGPFLIRDRDAHRKLIEIAKERHLYLWYGTVKDVNGKPSVVGHHLIDWDSVPDEPAKPGDKPATVAAAPAVLDLRCKKCGAFCLNKASFVVHQTICTGQLTKSARTCKKCGDNFVNNTALKAHIDNCTGTGKRFTCPNCGKACSAKFGLTLHLKHCTGAATDGS